MESVNESKASSRRSRSRFRLPGRSRKSSEDSVSFFGDASMESSRYGQQRPKKKGIRRRFAKKRDYDSDSRQPEQPQQDSDDQSFNSDAPAYNGHDHDDLASSGISSTEMKGSKKGFRMRLKKAIKRRGGSGGPPRIIESKSDDSELSDRNSGEYENNPRRLQPQRSYSFEDSDEGNAQPDYTQSEDDIPKNSSYGGAGGRSTAMRRPSSDSEFGGPPIRNVSFDMGSGSDHMSSSQHGPNSSGSSMPMGYGGRASNRGQEGQRARYNSEEGRRASKRKFRIRPFQRFPEPLYLTEEDLYTDSTQPSESYEFLKSFLAPTAHRLTRRSKVSDEIKRMYGTPADDGRIGALRIEVLGCVSLARTKPDVGVYIVSGDSAFCSDVIQGYRSPMWPSKSRRAAVFPVHHVYAKVYAGVFDVKARKNKENDVFCGRVVIDIASLRPGTEYDITYPLRSSSFIYDRKKRGVIRLRFSLHLFSERAAVISVLRAPKTTLDTSPLVEGCPAIPCADPKTFRNVAVTVHGQDLPGKYSRNAFRATMREFNLYQQNLRVVVKHCIMNAVLYEKPYISAYLFCAGMHCIWSNAVSFVPPYTIGYLLILYIENYLYYVEETSYNEGYRPLSLFEVFKGLFFNSLGGERYFQPVQITKRAKARARSQRGVAKTLRRIQSDSSGGGDNNSSNDNNAEGEKQDHREFPFSDREAYPRFGVENALAPGNKSVGASNSRLHGRLSVYYASPTTPTEVEGGDEAEDESSDDSGGDDESIMSETGMGDNLFGLDDLDDEDDLMLDSRGTSGSNGMYGYGGADESNQTAKNKNRLRVGPPQDNEVSGRKIPPQVHLKKMEHMMHKISMNLAVELVHAPPSALVAEGAGAGGGMATDPQALGANDPTVQMAKKRRPPQDEFDRLLGLQAKSANPVNRILSSFLGPLQRIIRILVFLVRIAFNTATWRDPYLSFWVLCGMVLWLMILIMFPWRAFFFVLTTLSLGPQNILVRKYFERKAVEEEKKKEEDALAAWKEDAEPIYSSAVGGLASSNASTDGSKQENAQSQQSERKGFFGRSIASSSGTKPRRQRRFGSMSHGEPLADTEEERPAFSSDPSGQAGKGRKPRGVAVPYSRFSKLRFFDWPPDPTVSRATPLDPNWAPSQEPPPPTPGHQVPPPPQEYEPVSLQRNEQSGPLPEISFSNDFGVRQRKQTPGLSLFP